MVVGAALARAVRAGVLRSAAQIDIPGLSITYVLPDGTKVEDYDDDDSKSGIDLLKTHRPVKGPDLLNPPRPATKFHRPAMADLQLPYAFRDLRRPARYKAYYGGRGGGKSSSFAQELIVRGTQRPMRILCCREIQTSLAASVKQLLDDKIQQAGLGGFYHSTQSGIRSPNGTRFLFAGLKSDPETVRSMEGLGYSVDRGS